MPIYLDHNATTPLRAAAWEAMRPFATEAFGNPSSAHVYGRKARQALEDAREQVASLLSARPEEVVFTSGATEANNLALFGLVSSGHVLAAQIEHPCVIEPLRQLAGRGADVEWLPVGKSGQVAQADVIARLRPDTRLISLMLANHETGAIQPVRHIAKTVPKSVLVHTDAAQAVGKIPVHFHDLGVAALTASAHKFGGPKGVGLLLIKHGVVLKPQQFGGHQQRGHRPGTEPVSLAVGLAVALAEAIRELGSNAAPTLGKLRDHFLKVLVDELGMSAIVVNTPMNQDSLPGTLNVSFPGCRSELLLMSLDLAGVACSTGSACSSGSLLPSPVLQAMGLSAVVLESAMRFSFSASQTEHEMIDAARRVAACVRLSV